MPYLSSALAQRARENRPVRVGVIGCGKFATMFLAQARLTVGMHVGGVADIAPERARKHLAAAGYPVEAIVTGKAPKYCGAGKIVLTEDRLALITDPTIDIIVEATGDPAIGIGSALAAFHAGKHVVMVNVEADALCGPLLAKRARAAGVIYSLAWGDQPALICEHVDWARSCGFEVVAAGKGTRYLPNYHTLNPDTVWPVLQQYLALDDPQAINLQMFNSFLDGTKSAIEMTAVANACDLAAPGDGLAFPPASRFELADVLRPRADGGTLERSGMVEVVSSLNRDGTDVPHHLAMGTYVVVTSDSAYARQCLREYNCLPDESGKYAALYRPTHMIGLELGLSVASIAVRGEPTGAPTSWNADVAAVAKRDLKAGETLDGEGGFTVWGRIMPAAASRAAGAFPIGLAKGVRLTRDITAGAALTYADVALDEKDLAVMSRRKLEAEFPSRS